jgi:sporulation protein YlmC with PRC-barrel domain
MFNIFKKRVEIISNNLKDLNSLEMYSAYFGRKVYSKSGEFVGKVYDVGMKDQCFVGIFVKGKRKVFIEENFISSDKDGIIMLSMEPVINLLGKKVYDSKGKMMGKVIDIERKTNSNNYEGLVVKKSFFRRSFSIPKKDIEAAKKNIMLNTAY